MESVIQINHLTKHFKNKKAVDDISLVVKEGELFGFLGCNGAGKTTTIHMLCTILTPSAGDARVCGYRLGQQDSDIRARIGIVYQDNCLDDILTVKENLLIRGHLYEKSSQKVKNRLHKISEILQLEDLLPRRFGKLSGGQKRKCEIARALMNRPKLLFLDEPTTGLDPATRKSVWEGVETLRKAGDMSVFLTTHYMEEAAIADTIAIMDEGKIKEHATPYELKEKYAYDTLKLYFYEDVQKEHFFRRFREHNIRVYQDKEGISVKMKHTMEAIPILHECETSLRGFEVIQGTMDDVFLNCTGKKLVETEDPEAQITFKRHD
ncbi:MAG: ATP-binding cassette domain-containing protein [Lachnospiraceae bacterium]|jgi:multidrug/hemolysin transport system ATP-binding protein|nr:ATP-binding cassette domain-containing protein [Lachnospiraceae bacterium]